MFLIFHMISHVSHVTLLEGAPQSTILSSLMVIGTVLVEI